MQRAQLKELPRLSMTRTTDNQHGYNCFDVLFCCIEAYTVTLHSLIFVTSLLIAQVGSHADLEPMPT